MSFSKHVSASRLWKEPAHTHTHSDALRIVANVDASMKSRDHVILLARCHIESLANAPQRLIVQLVEKGFVRLVNGSRLDALRCL